METNFYRLINADISPTDFELLCLETLRAYGEKEGLKDFSISHNQKVETFDSTYQIDIMAEYTALGCKNKVIVECKKLSRNVERSVVTDLYAKTQSIGAQKAILISTSGFQADAVKYAGAHGIALWQICDEKIKHITASAYPRAEYEFMWEMTMRYFLPHFFVVQWDCSADWPLEELYPTDEIERIALEKAAEYIRSKIHTKQCNT